jgi:hypothetical protein
MNEGGWGWNPGLAVRKEGRHEMRVNCDRWLVCRCHFVMREDVPAPAIVDDCLFCMGCRGLSTFVRYPVELYERQDDDPGSYPGRLHRERGIERG